MKVWPWPASLTWGPLHNRVSTFQAHLTKLFSKDLASGPEKSKMRTSRVWTPTGAGAVGAIGDGFHQAWRTQVAGQSTVQEGVSEHKHQSRGVAHGGAESPPLKQEVSSEEDHTSRNVTSSLLTFTQLFHFDSRIIEICTVGRTDTVDSIL